jgi:predicted unusual protein kinase regulating ubiquinone biosynthesis (AarF/ABC1/UbiB family)
VRRLAIAAGIGAVSAAALTLLRGSRNGLPGLRRLRLERGLAAVRLAARGGARYATSAPRLFASAGEHREALRNDLALQTAEDVAATLGTMKGVLMKLGQMASYVDDSLSPAARRTLSRLQDSVPPMSPELAAQVITEELGQPPDRAFATWDPEPIAAASIGQVHRAITRDGRAVAVKVQYPGIAETIEADLGNVALLRRMLKITAPMQDVDALLAELRERVTEELDYRREARNQQMFARYYAGHPTIGVPGIVPELCTRRVVTSDLADGARFAELLTWSQAERDLAAETIYRFVFRSLYGAQAFNGDPHPGNYLFHPGGRVTFLDFGLVKHFTPGELRPLVAMVKHLCVDNDPDGFRRAMEDAGFLMRGAPLPTDMIVEHMAVFYDTVRERGPRTMTGAYASAVTRRFFDFRSPLAAYVQIPRSYVILQRINLGLFALLGELSATADWRCIAEEIWPFVQGPPCTPMGAAEAGWRAGKLPREQVERPQVPGRRVADEGRRGRDPAGEDVELRTQCRGLGVHRARAGHVPPPGGQAVLQRLDRGDRLGRGERAVPGTMHEDLAEQAGAAGLVDGGAVRLLVLGHDQPVARGVHGQHRDRDPAVEGDVLDQVGLGVRAGLDPRRAVQRQQVLGQAQPGRPVERNDFLEVGGLSQVGEVVHAGVPGRVATGPGLEFGPEGEDEREGHLRTPHELVRLLGGVVGGGGFGGQGGEPAGRVAERRDQGEAGPALRGRLGLSPRDLGGLQVGRGVGDVDGLHRGVDQLLERELRVERGVPGGHAAGQHAAHGQRGVEPLRVVLQQPGGDDAAQRVPPGDRRPGLAVEAAEGVQRVDLVG